MCVPFQCVDAPFQYFSDFFFFLLELLVFATGNMIRTYRYFIEIALFEEIPSYFSVFFFVISFTRLYFVNIIRFICRTISKIRNIVHYSQSLSQFRNQFECKSIEISKFSSRFRYMNSGRAVHSKRIYLGDYNQFIYDVHKPLTNILKLFTHTLQRMNK